MITSSLAGCLGDDAEEIVEPIVDPQDDMDPQDEIIYGNVMVSTYHVGELVKAVLEIGYR